MIGLSIIAAMNAPEERLPREIYSAAQVREVDRRAIAGGIESYALMTRAASAALEVLRGRWPAARRLRVYCGAGNNGGDGYVLARLAVAAGLDVRVEALVAIERLKGDAATAARDCVRAGVPVAPFATGTKPDADVLVDGIFGTGLDRPAAGMFAAAIDAMNASGLPVLALDVPSGLDADTGWPLGTAVKAAVTVTFVGLKQGLFLGVARDHCGTVEFADLGVPADARRALAPPLERLRFDVLAQALPPRARTSHKGTHGRLLLLGGAPGMSGAIRLAAEAALRAGAGLVHVGTHPVSVGPVMAGRPEIMCRTVASAEEAGALLAMVDGVVVGPGLGQDEWGVTLWRAALGSGLPLVVDADALNLLAVAPVRRGQWLLTPHPGEAGRLLGLGTADVQRSRAKAARTLAERFDAVTVLKGACTLVAAQADAPLAVCDRGNPGMAAPGMGDVLSGVLGALLVQTRDLALAAKAGVLLHALAGDTAAANGGERGTVAGDLLPEIRRWANPSS
jgi:NAD(P)H-hydrate epimerase